MRFEESLKIQSIIKKHCTFKNIINLGSGNVEQLKKTKPWVSKNVFDETSEVKVKPFNDGAFPAYEQEEKRSTS